MKLICTIMLLALPFTLQAKETINFSSGEQQTTLIELYTSEGCSSCPPADKWLSGLKSDPKLWKAFIPVAFHVDYWGYIGWKDTLALPGNTQRQSQYKGENKIAFVYTPGFVVNGQEWQAWFKQRSLHLQKTQNASVLKAEIKDNRAEITYLGAKQNFDYHVAILGFDIHSRISSGENSGRSLNHDFVALSHDTVTAGNNHVSLNLPVRERFQNNPQAIAIWINTPDSLTPIQAVGGWIQ